MGTLTIRDLDDAVKDRLRVLAATNGRSMEAEARAILAEAVRVPSLPGATLAPERLAPAGVHVAKPARRRGGWSDLARTPGVPPSSEILDELREEPLGPGGQP